jgi:hypothetical protein
MPKAKKARQCFRLALHQVMSVDRYQWSAEMIGDFSQFK